MRLSFLNCSKRIHLAVLKLAGRLVPRQKRQEWMNEWRGELWHVWRACLPEGSICWEGEREATAFCLGAFKDAFCLRQQFTGRKFPFIPARGSATHCLLILSALALGCVCLALRLPGARSVLEVSPYRDSRGLMLIGSNSYSGSPLPSVRADRFRAWRNVHQHLFTEFAFYQPAVKAVRDANHKPHYLRIARSSPNLFDLLGLQVQYSTQNLIHPAMPDLVLTDTAWRSLYREDPRVFGQVIKVGIRDAVLVGIIPQSKWRLPGNVDGCLLEPDNQVAAISNTSNGFVVARLDPSALRSHLGEDWLVSFPRADGSFDQYLCVSLAERLREPLSSFLFTVGLALLALPATTPLALGEYPVPHRKLSWAKRLRRWTFLACKVTLVFIIVGFGSLDLAHLRASVDPVSSQSIQLLSSFAGCLFALRWTLRDQRSRCPVCLGKLTCPAHVGQTSRNFLAWYGTELICNEGHGLLHVPEVPTSWFATQRWLYLDPSWDVLFSEPHPAPAGVR
jgi:hypothetical protein